MRAIVIKMGMTVVEKLFFFFPKLELFTDSTFNTSVRDEEELSIVPLIPSVSHPTKDDNDYLFAHFSDNNSSFPQKSTRICYESTRYGLVAQYITLLSIAQSEIYESLNYHEVI